MCDVLICEGSEVLKAWFGDSLEALPRNWAQVHAQGDVQACLQTEKPKIALLGDSLLKRDVQQVVQWAGNRTLVVVVSDHFQAHRFQTLLEWGVDDLWVTPIDLRLLNQNLKASRLGIQVFDDHYGEQNQIEDEMVVGKCPDMVKVLKTASVISKTDATVLIRGESGTGKELLARKIHDLSGRSGKFVAINCAAVSEGVAESELFGHERGAFTGAVSQRLGCFELAQGGTLFLDEVGDASANFQAKLLRVLERNEFMRVGGEKLIWTDVRVIAATNTDVESLVRSGDFRLDLQYRLGAMSLYLPPLRDRRADMPEIVRKLVRQLNRRLHRSVGGVSRQALEQLMAYEWPGNLRELYNVLHRAVLLCRRDMIDVEHLQDVGGGATCTDLVSIKTLDELEQDHIARVLDIASGNRGRACTLLGISRPTLRRKLRQYALSDTTVPA